MKEQIKTSDVSRSWHAQRYIDHWTIDFRSWHAETIFVFNLLKIVSNELKLNKKIRVVGCPVHGRKIRIGRPRIVPQNWTKNYAGMHRQTSCQNRQSDIPRSRSIVEIIEVFLDLIQCSPSMRYLILLIFQHFCKSASEMVVRRSNHDQIWRANLMCDVY